MIYRESWKVFFLKSFYLVCIFLIACGTITQNLFPGDNTVDKLLIPTRNKKHVPICSPDSQFLWKEMLNMSSLIW